MPGLTRKRRAAEQEEQSEDSQNESQDETQQQLDDDSDAGRDNGASALNDMVKSLVRLALAMEYQRKPLRRAEIGEKVLGTQGRAFKKVFAQAQHELRTVFGMQLVELPTREKVTVAQKRAAQQKDNAPKTTSAWMLTSVLPSEYHDPEVVPPSAIPSSTEDSQYTAIYSLLVALICLNGGSLPHAKMERFLRRLGMEDATPVVGSEKPEKLLKRFEKENYIVKVSEAIGANEEEVSWHVGSRGKVEVGPAGIKGLVEAVYGNPENDEGTELARKIERSLGVGEKPAGAPAKKQRKTRERASGGRRDDTDDDDD